MYRKLKSGVGLEGIEFFFFFFWGGGLGLFFACVCFVLEGSCLVRFCVLLLWRFVWDNFSKSLAFVDTHLIVFGFHAASTMLLWKSAPSDSRWFL